MFYPWSAYRGQSIPIYEHGAVSSWANLQNWATLYKTMSGNGTGISTSSVPIDASDANSKYNFLHKVRILPVIARIQWVFSHWGAKLSSPPGPQAPTNPVYWSPLSSHSGIHTTSLSPRRPSVPDPRLPADAFSFNVNGVQNQKYNSISASTNNSPNLGGGDLWFNITSSYTFKPGETLLFSPTGYAGDPGSNKLTLQPGFRKQGGHYFRLEEG